MECSMENRIQVELQVAGWAAPALLAVVLALLFSCGAPEQQDPVSVVQAFYDAASEEDIEAIMALLAGDAKIERGRDGIVTARWKSGTHPRCSFWTLISVYTRILCGGWQPSSL